MRMKLTLVLSLLSIVAEANETECLSKILYAEARGGSINHVATLGQTAITKAREENKTLCSVSGVKRLTPTQAEKPYFNAVAKELLQHEQTSLSKGANRWDKIGHRVWPGKVTRELEGHKFYKLK